MNIRNLFEEKKCVFSFEMFPPKKNSDDINAMYETIDGLKRLGPTIFLSLTARAEAADAVRSGLPPRSRRRE